MLILSEIQLYNKNYQKEYKQFLGEHLTGYHGLFNNFSYYFVNMQK